MTTVMSSLSRATASWAGRFDSASGPGAIAVVRSNRVIVNGFLPIETDATNNDADAYMDGLELRENQILYLLNH